MPRYIDADNIKLKGISVFDQNLEILIPLSDVRKSLQMTPTADVQEVRHGRWIRDSHNIVCSVCGGKRLFKKKKPMIYKAKPTIHKQGYCVSYNSRFCPNCGAKMDDKEAEPKATEKWNKRIYEEK